MKDRIRNMLEECLNNATKDDLTVLEQLLNGIKRKQHLKRSSYIGGILQMSHEKQQDYAKVRIPISALTDNSFHIVHGGITATILDTAMGSLANQMLPDDLGAVTSNLHIHYIAPGKGSELCATAKLIHQGTKTMILEGFVHRDDGVKIAHCTGTFYIIQKKKSG
ncbi:PaaI family thioesterase [Bacillus chungangensis]|uniref:Uncharacterized protein (TIGR00369 family) n=1 Tax=Bacillus chungangensis TaxID=587633 RepID=A0ABT9WXT9_9BACI|nr:PaaI family thioesterase [Bacillus chungangensis]MDQ0177692.1 uncharacterized protein (TIGR00369 family) [Bacillus chungangensis]